MRKPKDKPKGKWVFQPFSPEEYDEEQKDKALEQAMLGRIDFADRLKGMQEFHDVFPESGQSIPDGGAWIMIKTPPPTEFTVPPFSFWFCEPWPHGSDGGFTPKRVKVVTPRGDLGVYPREYSRVDDMAKYIEFVGDGMEIKFFGATDGLPKDKLFYLRSRGIGLKDAITMLIGEVKSPGVCWLETKREVASAFVRNWPDDKYLATIQPSKEIAA